MKAWESFYPFILPDVMGCPYPMVDHALTQAAREFCQRTSAWVEWMDMVAPGNTQRFDFDLPAQTDLVAARRATVDGVDINVLGNRNLPPNWDRTGATFEPDALIHISLTEFMLFPTPDAGITVTIEMAVKPTLTAKGIADDVFSRYVEPISKGALFRLQSSPGKPYSNNTIALLSRSEFERGIQLAANEPFRQSTFSDRKVRKHF